jgi:hypothetical protein
MSISSRAGLLEMGASSSLATVIFTVGAISAAIVTPKHNQMRQPNRAYARCQSTHMWTGRRPYAIGG